MNTISLIASKLTERNETIIPVKDSIFHALSLYNKPEDEVTICKRLADIINNDLILVKNKLIPFTQDIAKILHEEISKAPDNNEISKYNISTYSVPALVPELVSAKLVGTRVEDITMDASTILIPVPEDIKSFFKSDKGSVDIYVQQLVGKYNENELVDIWERYLSSIGPANENIQALGRNIFAMGDILCLVFIALDNLRKGKIAGVSAPDKVYDDVIETYYNKVRNLLAILLDDFKIQRKLGRLVYKIEDKTAYVDEEVYDRFIQELGQPDIILGLIASPNKRELEHYSIEDVKTNASNYLATWDNLVKLEQHASIGRSIEQHKLIYNITFAKILREYVPFDLKEYVTDDNETMYNAFRDILNTLQPSEILDYNLVARYMVGKVMFKSTNYDFFTNYMLDCQKVNPSLTAADAATFASLNFILKYILAQVTVTNTDVILKG